MEREKILVFGFFCFYLLFGLACLLFFGAVNNTSDWFFHWGHLAGADSRPYPPFYYFLFAPLAVNQFLFYTANIFLITVLIPLLLFKLSKSIWSILIYVFGVSLPNVMIANATFPQALVLIFFLVYLLNRRNFWVFLVLSLAASLTHSYGLELFGAIAGIELLSLAFKQRFPAVFLTGVKLHSLKELGVVFLSQLPIPIFWLALKKSGPFFLALITLSFFAATIDFRGICVAQVLVCAAAGQTVKEYSRRFKAVLLIFLALQSVFSFYSYLAQTVSFLM